MASQMKNISGESLSALQSEMKNAGVRENDNRRQLCQVHSLT